MKRDLALFLWLHLKLWSLNTCFHWQVLSEYNPFLLFIHVNIDFKVTEILLHWYRHNWLLSKLCLSLSSFPSPQVVSRPTLLRKLILLWACHFLWEYLGSLENGLWSRYWNGWACRRYWDRESILEDRALAQGGTFTAHKRMIIVCLTPVRWWDRCLYRDGVDECDLEQLLWVQWNLEGLLYYLLLLLELLLIPLI
jgi:hypothetical protein